MVAFTFALLAASVQGSSANILAATPKFTLRKLDASSVASGTGGITSTSGPSCEPTQMEQRLGFFHILSVKIPESLKTMLDIDTNRGHDWMLLPSALFGAATTVLLALKMFLFQKLISNFIAKLAVLVTSAFAAWSPLQTALTMYGCAKGTFSEVFFGEDWTESLESLARLIAMPANIAAIVMTVMGFNPVITYAVAVASYAVTFYGNLGVVTDYFCNNEAEGYTAANPTWGFQAVKAVKLEESLCEKAAATV